MSTDLLLRKFDRAGDAPEAVPLLRRFILDLAVRGKLTERDPSDEPASHLLVSIEEEMWKGEGARRRFVKFGPMGSDEAPFCIPDSWLWTRVRQITRDRGQTVPRSRFTYIDVSAIDKELGRLGDPVVLSPNDAPSRARKIVSRGDVLYSCVRPYLLNIAVVDTDLTPPPIASTAFAVLDGFGLVASRYLWTVLRSPYFVACVEAKMRGQAYPAINDSDFAQLPIPLPPLAEQGRLVAKVDELMSLCDQLEIAQKESEAKRESLRAASLHRLTSTDDETSFSNDVRFFLSTSPRLITKPEHLAELRQSILDLAVRGRLVKRDGGDEPASTLLARLDDERATGGEKRRRREVDATAIEPMELPNHWEATHLYRLAASIDYGTSQLATLDARGVPVLRMGNIANGKISLKNLKYVEQDQIDDSLLLSPGDLIFNRTNSAELVGKNAVFLGSVSPMTFASYLIRVRSLPSSDMRWVNAVLMSDSGRQYLASVQSQQTGQANINGTKLAEAPIPLPPLAEQQRIVAKLEELMAVCDDLQSALATSQIERAWLLEALLHEALDKS
jgi:type I restriction enzyme S subunit